MIFQFGIVLLLMSNLLPEKTIFDFNDAESVQPWRIVNDGVMGGLSSSAMQWQAGGTARFAGQISLENNGGFASVRTTPQDYQLAGYSGIQLRVRGDGNSYKFRIQTDANFDGVTYSANFTAPVNEWAIVQLPFADFQPTWRGRVLPDVGPLKAADIRQLGFLISDKQSGTFALEVDWIKAF